MNSGSVSMYLPSLYILCVGDGVGNPSDASATHTSAESTARYRIARVCVDAVDFMLM
jgi:hypothetical protein